MKHEGTARLTLIFSAWCGASFLARAQSISDYAVRVSATVQTNPARITLSWPADAHATDYTLYRKLRDDTNWGPGITLATNATGYYDTNVPVGSAYEYGIFKDTTYQPFYGEGEIYAGIQAPLTEYRGKLVLIVDNTYATNLAAELTRLQQDLVGDGWTVLRHNVPRMAVDPANTSSSVWASRSNELASVKWLIKADYNADPVNVESVFVFGRVPVPYSGDLAPDDHFDHVGAWPADGFYADMDGVWTDSTVTDSNASDPRNRNVPGDGKFDQTELPSDLELQVGRVDFANMPAFPQGERELLRQYLNKDHNFRHKMITAQPRGLIADNLGSLSGEAPAVNGWRNFAPFFASSNTFSGNWLATLSTQSYLWGYACGGGTFTSESGVATTAQLVTNDTRVVFTMHFGSYFGDWDSQNNLLRAQLSTTSYTLTSAWASRPSWYFHHMALGETVGFSTRATQNNINLYDVHIALMGDPTLRMHPVAPPSQLVVATNSSGGVDLTWNSSPDVAAGYRVYRAATAAGPFTPLNSGLIASTNYTDPVVTSNVYMVRAVKLEVSGSGSYYNPSQGIFQALSNSFGPRVLTITAQNTNKVYGAALPAFSVLYAGFTNGDTPANLSSPPVLSTPATAASPAGAYPIQVSGAVSSNYIIRYVSGTLTILPAASTGLVTSSANPSLPGQPVAFTATLSAVAPGVGTLTGTVRFKTDGMNAGAPVSLGGGMANYTNSSLAHGTHTVTAEYAGDGNFTGCTNLLSPAQLINTPPVAGGVTIERDPTNSVKVAIAALLSNDSDADGDPITFLGASTNSDTFTYTISDGLGTPVTGAVTVNVRTSNGPPANLTIMDLGSGAYAIRGDGIPDRTYRIQFSNDPQGTNWQTLATATSDSAGVFQVIDSSGSTQRFYRSVYP